MVTLLNCIERIPSLINRTLDEREEIFGGVKEMTEAFSGPVREIILVGSGTSSTAILTAQPFMEKVTKKPVRLLLPGAAVDPDTALPKDALYVFLSQTGTSALVQDAHRRISALGYACLTMTENGDTDLAKMSSRHLSLTCGPEEYGMRTIGYTISVLDLELLALYLALAEGTLGEEEFNEYIDDAKKVPESLTKVIADTHLFFRRNQRQMMRSRCIVFTGAKALYGLSLEAAVKFWEMPQVISIGYELEEGMHGPNYGYDTPHCVIVMTTGSEGEEKGRNLARYMKEVFHNGLLVGPEPLDDSDLRLVPQSENFQVLEFSAVPQVLAYDLAEAGGRDLTVPSDLSLMESYFSTHTHW